MIHVLLTRTPHYSSLRTFSFDLHVLGAPPALILSRDQTLILSCEFSIAPVELRVLTKCFSASNQIVKDLYSCQAQSLAPATAGLETCLPPHLLEILKRKRTRVRYREGVSRQNFRAFLKELPGRPLTASAGGPEKFVTIPCYFSYLTTGLYFLATTRPKLSGNRQAQPSSESTSRRLL